VPGEPPSRILDAVRGLAHDVALERGVGVSIKPQRMDRGLETSPAGELVRFLEQASGRAPATAAYYTEAPHFAELGAEAVVFGPGDIRVAHATGEHVPVEEMERCADVLARAINRFCG
jgi:acetylornithine deacetylase